MGEAARARRLIRSPTLRQVWLVALFVIAALPLIAQFVRFGTVPYGQYTAVDGHNFLERTQWVLEHGRPHPIDPPLRYLPYAALAALTGASGMAIWPLMTGFTAAVIWGWVPAWLAGIGHQLRDPTLGIGLIAGYGLAVSKGWTGNNYLAGSFQNVLVWGILTVALWLAVVDLQRSASRRRYIVGIGVLLGLSGLFQLTNTALTAAFITLAYLLRRRPVSLTSLAALALVFQPAQLLSTRVVEKTSDHLFLTDRNPVLGVTNYPGVAVTLALCWLALAAGVWHLREHLQNWRRAVGVAALLTVGVWGATAGGLQLPYYNWSTATGRVSLGLVGIAAVAAEVLPDE